MSDDPADHTGFGLASAHASTDTIYTVLAGDSLSKIAQQYYGDARRYPEIAARNNLAANSIVYIGQRLIIPAAQRTAAPRTAAPRTAAPRTVEETTLPASPGGSVPTMYNGELIETVTTSAVRVKFWEDWRFWLAVGGIAGLLWYLSRPRR